MFYVCDEAQLDELILNFMGEIEFPEFLEIDPLLQRLIKRFSIYFVNFKNNKNSCGFKNV